MTLTEQSIDIAREYVEWALSHGFTTSDIAYSLGNLAAHPSEGQVTRMVARAWLDVQMSRSPTETMRPWFDPAHPLNAVTL